MRWFIDEKVKDKCDMRWHMCSMQIGGAISYDA